MVSRFSGRRILRGRIFQGGILCLAFTLSQGSLPAFSPVFLPGAARALELAEVKQTLDQHNLNWVMDWLGNDLKGHATLGHLAPRLTERKAQILAELPRHMGSVAYEDLLIQALAPEPGVQEALRQLIRHSVNYLNLSDDPQVLSLREVKIPPAAALPPMKQIEGFPDELESPGLSDLSDKTPHTIGDLQGYNQRRLGQAAVQFAIAEGLPFYLFDSAGPEALHYLADQGYDAFYHLNAFYTRWGKETYLVRRGKDYALAYTGIYGSFMEQHLLHMLKTTVFAGQRLKPSQIQRVYTGGVSRKAQWLQAYREDLKAWNAPRTVLVLGYLNLLGKDLQQRYRTQWQTDWLQSRLDAHELAYQLRYSSQPQFLQGLVQETTQNETALAKWQADCPQCPLQAAWREQQLQVPVVSEDLAGKALLAQRFWLKDEQGETWQFLNVGANHSLYGDMTAELVRIALEEGIQEVVFAGSAGAVNPRFPIYSFVLPSQLRDYQGQPQPFHNAWISTATAQPLSYASMALNTHHQGVISPVAETQDLIRLLQKEAIDTVDVEVAEVAKVMADFPAAHFSVALLVTDYPGAFLQPQQHHLDAVDYRQKYQQLPQLVSLLMQHYRWQKVVNHGS